MLIQFIGPSNPTEIPLQVIPRKLTDLDIDALEQDINMGFKENSPYQVGVNIRNVPKVTEIIFPGTTRIARSSEYRQNSTNFYQKKTG